MNKIVGYCGIDCSKCNAYIATITNDNELKEKTARLWSKLNNAKILPENINCNGASLKALKQHFAQIYVLLENVR